MDGGAVYNPRTVEGVYGDFKGRRAGMIKALTTEVEEFYQQCDPEKEKLCLYGFPSEEWVVNLPPPEEMPPEVPEPAFGINFARDGMQEKDWLSLVAVHSDAWLLSVAFYFGARYGFDKADRTRLFSMINGLPTIFEVVTGTKTLCGATEQDGALIRHERERDSFFSFKAPTKWQFISVCVLALTTMSASVIFLCPRPVWLPPWCGGRVARWSTRAS